MGSGKNRKKETEDSTDAQFLWGVLLKEKRENILVLVREIVSERIFLIRKKYLYDDEKYPSKKENLMMQKTELLEQHP